MKISHIHLGVEDLTAAIAWVGQVLQASPSFANEKMASITFGGLTLIFDRAPRDVQATIGFESTDCDADFNTLVARGGVPLEAPRDQPWSARAAYIRGPGALTIELEEMRA
jgi:catechol 2,3-dioxygenase-like lactoylglutathione lyase family enzyme